jgi:hypothetical protein
MAWDIVGEKHFYTSVFLLLLPVSALAGQKQTPPRQSPVVVDSRMSIFKMETAKAASEYKASLKKLLEFEENDVKTAAETLEKRRASLAANEIDKKEIDKSEMELARAQARVADTKKQIAEADKLIAEAVNGPLFIPSVEPKKPVKAKRKTKAKAVKKRPAILLDIRA